LKCLPRHSYLIMSMHHAAMLLALIDTARNREELAAVMTAVTPELGFRYFALSHHVDLGAERDDAVQLHNYPERWAAFHASHALGVSDPVHRASHRTGVGFLWSKMSDLISLTAQDSRILRLGSQHGIAEGFTIPSNIAGEPPGSCSFANEPGRPAPPESLLLAQLVGAHAFERARLLWPRRRQVLPGPPPVLTARQLACIFWAARGKNDWEIGCILGISEETVARHIKDACARYQVNKRILLIGWTLMDGTFTIDQIFGTCHAPFRS